MWPFNRKEKHVCEYELTHATKNQSDYYYGLFSGSVHGYLCMGVCKCGKIGAWIETVDGPKFIIKNPEWAALKFGVDPSGVKRVE